jgi:hypothetical protein
MINLVANYWCDKPYDGDIGISVGQLPILPWPMAAEIAGSILR